MVGRISYQRAENPESWSKDQVCEWFDQKGWLGQTALQPGPSINKKEFAVRYHQNKGRWDKAFAFLKDENLSALEVGNQKLNGDNVFVKVFEEVLEGQPSSACKNIIFKSEDVMRL